MKIFRRILGLFLGGLVLVSCAGGSNTGLAKEGKLIVGMECDYQPFNFLETSNTSSNVAIANVSGSYADGYDVQIAKIIAKELNLELEVKAIAWDGLIPALNSSEIDLIIAGMSVTEERLTSIDFTDAYYKSEEVLIVKSDSQYKEATSLDDLSGATVIGQLGTIYADLVSQTVAHGAKAGTNLDTVPAIINAIVNNVVDATIVELPVAASIISEYEGLSLVRFAEGKGFTVSDSDVSVNIGIRKNFTYKDKINEILSTISEDQRKELMDQASFK